MASIDGVQKYVHRAIKDEKQCMEELSYLVDALAGGREVPHVKEKILKLRNISRDVGWMRRLLADLIHEDLKLQGRALEVPLEKR